METRQTFFQQQIRIRHLSPRVAWCVIGVIALLTFSLCIFYLLHSYTWLAQWFLSLNDDIPHRGEWQKRYFSPGVKQAGNIVCMLALPVSVLSAIYAVKKAKQRYKLLYGYITVGDLAVLLFFPIAAIVLWVWGQPMAAVGSDEMYSAYYSAGGHPFQVVSYYMDPNNHILFNLINRLAFYGVPDKVFTGRLISLGAYIALASILYLWLKKVTSSRMAAFFITLALCVQFQVVGFAQLARGYELYLLCQWLAFIALYNYLRDRHTTYLLWYALANIAGFFTIPTHLYFFVTITLAAVLFQLKDRKADLRFWAYTFFTLIVTGLLYLPSILFSGLKSLTANEYVSARNGFEIAFTDNFRSIVQECFWINYPNRQLIFGLLLLLPLPFIFFRGKKEWRLIWICYLLIWPVYFTIAIAMKHFANMRNVIWQEQFMLCCVLLALFYLFKKLSVKSAGSWPVKIVYPLLLSGVIVHFLAFFPWQIDYALYGISTRKHNDEVSAVIRSMPRGATLACPDFAISWYYLAKETGYHATVQNNGKESLLIVNVLDITPESTFPGYKFWKREAFYHLYIREDLPLPGN